MPNNIYVLPIKETLSMAWEKVTGSKKTVWAAFAILLVIVLLLELLKVVTDTIFPRLNIGANIISEIITTLLQMSFLYIGIRRAYNLPISADMMFHTFDFSLGIKCVVLYLLEVIIFFLLFTIITAGIIVSRNNTWGLGHIFLGPLLMVIGLFVTVYVTLRLVLAIGFVVDKETTPWQAIKWSFVASRKNTWQILVILFFQFLALFVSIIPLFGIGLIWSIPFVVISYGEIYKRLLVNIDNS